METVKGKLERTLKYWDQTRISTKQDGKWQEVPLSEVKNQSDIAKHIMLLITPFMK